MLLGLGMRPPCFKDIVPLSRLNMAFGINMRSPYTPYSIHLRGTIYGFQAVVVLKGLTVEPSFKPTTCKCGALFRGP